MDSSFARPLLPKHSNMAAVGDNGRPDEGVEDQVVVGILKKKGEGWVSYA